MTQFTYDLCLLYKTFLIDKTSNKSTISDILGMQTDDTLYETIEAFAKQKDEAIKSPRS